MIEPGFSEFPILMTLGLSLFSFSEGVLDMNIRRIQPNARMSAAVVCNGFVFVSGQVADDSDADVAGQTAQILGKIERILTEAGSSKERIVSANIWLADAATFNEMNGIWDAWVAAGHPPARACVESKLAFPQYTVEIGAIAAL